MVPRQSAELTANWLNEVLSPHFGQSFTDHNLKIIGEGVGVLGELSRLTVTLEDGSSRSAVCKFSAAVPEAREFARMMGFYESECRFYDHLAPGAPVQVPQVYFLDFEPDTYQFTIIMEDVAGEVGDQVTGCSRQQAIDIVTELARIHSHWSDVSKLADFPWLRDFRDILNQSREQTIASLPVFFERFPEITPQWLRELEADLPDILVRIADDFDSRPQCLVHGDYRLDNFVFNPPGSERAVTILDWQIIVKSVPVFDLGYFLSQSLVTDMRRETEADLISAYVSARQSGGDSVTEDSVRAELPLVVFYCIVYPVIAGALIDISLPRSRDLIEALATRSISAIEDYGALEAIRSLRSD